MAYEINLNLTDGWVTSLETEEDESGAEITHLEARLSDDSGDVDRIMIDVYVGDMPEGETAEDQAFANYAEAVGFDEEDDRDGSPLQKFKFNGKNAYGFDAETEEGCPMRFFAQEIRKGTLLIVAFFVCSEDLLLPTFELIERNLRIK